jgi:hypothetical protein
MKEQSGSIRSFIPGRAGTRDFYRDWMLPVLFWGAVWGFVEATLGFVLHKAAIAIPGLPGFVMFPIACIWMDRVITVTRKPAAAFGAACVAAGIKLLDFVLPGAIPLRILNPAASLLLEGLVVWGLWHGRGGMRTG